MKQGPSIPGWAAGVAIGAVVLILVLFGLKAATGSGPLPENQYPKEAFQAPGYSAQGGSQAPTATKDGIPVSGGRPGSTQEGSQSRSPYGDPYGGRPGPTGG